MAPTVMPDLTTRLRERIRAHGPLAFAEFMAAALYDPEHGYYGSGRARLGRKGDFFTSVSVGPLFGRLLARQFIEMWERLGAPSRLRLIEQGAHDGTLAADVLTGLRDFAPACAAAVELCLVEPSARWEQRQRETLAAFPLVRWVRTLPELSPAVGIVYANELLDAFPVHRVRWDGRAWSEQRVSWEGDRFVFSDYQIAAPALTAALSRLPVPRAEGYATEVSLAAGPWLRDAAAALSRGWILTLDYGFPREEYYRPERSEGTLTGYANHQRIADPLQSPGEIDLTAHVDFTTLLETGAEFGLTLAGFTDQQRFMAGLGRLHFDDTTEVSAERAREQRAFMTLLHPELMGAAFKAICFGKDVPEATLSGFHFAG